MRLDCCYLWSPPAPPKAPPMPVSAGRGRRPPAKARPLGGGEAREEPRAPGDGPAGAAEGELPAWPIARL